MAFTRKFLKDLGVDDSIIQDIMDEHGAELNSEKASKKQLRKELKQVQDELEAEQSKSKDTDDLTKQLEAKDADIVKLNHEIKAMHITSAIEKAGAVNADVVTKMLDLDKVDIDDKGALTGLDDQLKALKDGEATNFLFKAEDDDPEDDDGGGGSKPAGQKYDPNKGNSPKEKSYGARAAEAAKAAKDSGNDSGPGLWGE